MHVACNSSNLCFQTNLFQEMKTKSIENKIMQQKTNKHILITVETIPFKFQFLGYIPNHCSREENTRCPHPHELKDHQSTDIHCPVSDASSMSGYSKN